MVGRRSITGGQQGRKRLSIKRHKTLNKSWLRRGTLKREIWVGGRLSRTSEKGRPGSSTPRLPDPGGSPGHRQVKCSEKRVRDFKRGVVSGRKGRRGGLPTVSPKSEGGGGIGQTGGGGRKKALEGSGDLAAATAEIQPRGNGKTTERGKEEYQEGLNETM